MPLIMLGSDSPYTRSPFYAPRMLGADIPLDYDVPTYPTNAGTPGSSDWWGIANQVIATGGQVAAAWFKSQQKVAATPAQTQIVHDAAAQAGITLSEMTPWLIGGGAALVIVILLMSRKRK